MKTIVVGRDLDLPLVGCIHYGLIDRGTNVLQVRPTTICPLSCVFCSTDAGPKSRSRLTEVVVRLDLMLEWLKWAVKSKGCRQIEVHIDTVGDPLTYPWLPELVEEASSMRGVKVVSIQTHGHLLTDRLIEDLEEAGLSRVNLSIDALDPELAREISGTPGYSVERVKEMAEAIADSGIDLLIAPVWVPKLNDREIPRIIEFALEAGAGKRWPPLGVQKYLEHPRGRKPKGVKPMSWRAFYSKLREWEREYGVKLVLRREDFNIHPHPQVIKDLKVGSKIEVELEAPGWLKGEKIGVYRGRAVTVVDAEEIPLGARVRARVIWSKHGLAIVRPY